MTQNEWMPLHYLEQSHIDGSNVNPYARILCRGRLLSPTECDGTCLGCKKEREQYLERESERYLERNRANPEYGSSIDHVDEMITLSDARAIIMRRIAAIEERKKTSVSRAAELHKIVENRLQSLILRSGYR